LKQNSFQQHQESAHTSESPLYTSATTKCHQNSLWLEKI
jgi:hypothetical protein